MIWATLYSVHLPVKFNLSSVAFFDNTLYPPSGVEEEF